MIVSSTVNIIYFFLNLGVLVFILYTLIKIISATSLEVIVYLFLIDI